MVRLVTIDWIMIENICNDQASEAIFFVKLALQGVDWFFFFRKPVTHWKPALCALQRAHNRLTSVSSIPSCEITKDELLKCKVVVRPEMESLYSVTLSLSRPILPWFYTKIMRFNPSKTELNPICYLLALLGAHHFLHVSRIRVKLLTFRLLMSYIYGATILDVSRSHTTTQHSR